MCIYIYIYTYTHTYIYICIHTYNVDYYIHILILMIIRRTSGAVGRSESVASAAHCELGSGRALRHRSTEVPLRRSALSVHPCGNTPGDTPPIRNRLLMGPSKAPKGDKHKGHLGQRSLHICMYIYIYIYIYIHTYIHT